MINLKPCPFCGGESSCAFTKQLYSTDKIRRYPKCNNKECPVKTSYVTAATAIAAWNTRAAPTMKAWEWVESNAHGPAWKCDTFKALTYLAAGEWHVYIDLIFVGSVVASVQDAPELAKAIGVAYVERKLKEWLL